MIFWRLLELGFLAVTGLLLLTQVLVPLWVGRPLFPLLGPRRAAERRLGVAREKATLRDLDEETREVDFSAAIRGKYAGPGACRNCHQPFTATSGPADHHDGDRWLCEPAVDDITRRRKEHDDDRSAS